jgi:hypothetical protein
MKKKKRRRLVDQLYNGAFENAEFAPETKRSFYTSIGLIAAGVIGSIIITQSKK